MVNRCFLTGKRRKRNDENNIYQDRSMKISGISVSTGLIFDEAVRVSAYMSVPVFFGAELCARFRIF
jgi:hypothetical protein